MAKDLLASEDGDLVIDPVTHDLAIVTGADEIAQRIRATLLIRLGEMINIDPDQGTNYQNLLGKNFNQKIAVSDLTTAIKNNVPEVEVINNINLHRGVNRSLIIEFKVTADVDNDSQIVEGVFDIGN